MKNAETPERKAAWLLRAILLPLLPALAPSPALGASAADADIRKIPLVSTRTYDPRWEQGRHLGSFFTGIGAFLLGPSIDLRAIVSEKLETPALRAYFPDRRDRGRLAGKVAYETSSRYLGQGYTNGAVLAALRFATDEVVRAVVERVLEKEGGRDPVRARAWAGKVLAPFHRCMGLAISYTEGKKCASPLERDLPSNLGLALSYEMSRQQFGASFAAPRPAQYQRCLRPTEPGSEARVRGCALQGLRAAALAFARARVVEKAGQQLPAAAAEQVAESVRPGFESCLAAASEKTAFLRCGDSFLGQAGAAIVASAIRLDPRVAAQVPSAAERDRLAESGRAAFSRCVSENEREGRRDPKGTLLTDNCERAVRLETSLLVAEKKVRQALDGKLPDPAVADQLARTFVRQDFAQCLGPSPGEATLAECGLKLQKNVAYQAAKLMLPARVDDFLRQGGGESEYGLDGKGRQELLEAVIASHKLCLRKEVRLSRARQSEGDISSCFKRTIRDLALRLGDLEFARRTRQLAPGSAGASGDGFRADLGACLDERQDPRYSLDEYLAGLDSCRTRITAGYTAKIAKAFVRARALKELGGETLPEELEENGKGLDLCLSEGRQPAADCTLAYAKASTATVGRLALYPRLRNELGPEKFARAEPEARALAKSFEACVAGAGGPVGTRLMAELNGCAEQLTMSSMELVLTHMDDLSPPPAPPVALGERQLTEALASAFLCLSGSLPPEQEGGLGGLRAGTLESELLRLIASYVDYDLRAAQGQVEGVLKELEANLRAAGPEAARRKLLESLVLSGMVDQLLKSMVRTQLGKALESLPEGKRLPAALEKKALDKAVLDKALGPETMASLRPILAHGVLGPVLAGDRARMSSPGVRLAYRQAMSQAVAALLASPEVAASAEERLALEQALR